MVKKKIDCNKCMNIAFTKEDYEKCKKVKSVLEHVEGKKVLGVEEAPLCTKYGTIVEGYVPCHQCTQEKNRFYKERNNKILPGQKPLKKKK